MKVYLVSEVAYYSYGNDPINKKFEMFKTKEDAIKYKEKSAEKWIDILMI